jgi:hypothetical protein
MFYHTKKNGIVKAKGIINKMLLILMPNSRLLYTVQCCDLLDAKFIKVALGNCENNITCY